MTRPATETAAIPEIVAPIVYLVDTGEPVVFKQTDKAADTITMAGTREKKMMTVRNGRLERGKFSLDVEGFMLADHMTKVGDFFDDEQLRTIYTPEVERLVKDLTGASRVVVFDHTRRSSAAATRDKHNARDPVSAVHADYTDRSAVQRLRDVMGAQADALLEKRFAIINVWRSMNGVIEEWPLAVCDARSIKEDVMRPVMRNAPHRAEPSFEYSRPSETSHATFDAGHRWFYFPRMTRNEALLFKNYDTLTGGTARYALHTAIDDPTKPANPAPRESIESRVLVFYDA